jgi:hypothetical protein
VVIFNRIWANKGNFHNFKVKINLRLSGGFLLSWWMGLGTATQQRQNPCTPAWTRLFTLYQRRWKGWPFWSQGVNSFIARLSGLQKSHAHMPTCPHAGTLLKKMKIVPIIELAQTGNIHWQWQFETQATTKMDWATKNLKIRKATRKPGPRTFFIMFTPARDFLLETPWRIIIPNPNVNSHSLWSW